MSQVTENKVISAPVPMTPLQEFWHYFKRNKGAVVGLVYVVIVLFIAIFANWIAPYNPAEQFRDALLAPPAWQEGGSMAHLLGTDDVGRDVLSRLYQHLVQHTDAEHTLSTAELMKILKEDYSVKVS